MSIKKISKEQPKKTMLKSLKFRMGQKKLIMPLNYYTKPIIILIKRTISKISFPAMEDMALVNF